MIERVYSSELVDVIANSETVRPTLGGEGPLTLSELIKDRRNIVLLSGDNGALFAWRGPRVYEAHSFYTARGREAIEIGKAMLSFMGGHADLVWGLTPKELKKARWFNRQIGLVSLGMTETPIGPFELFEKRY